MVTPEQLIEALLANNWQVVGERAGLYKRLAILADDGVTTRHTLFIPLDESTEDYGEYLDGAVAYLERTRIDGLEAHRVLHHLNPELYTW